jgi:hypothetical protein
MSRVGSVIRLAPLAALALSGCGSGQDQSSRATVPTTLQSEARPIGLGRRFQPPARGPTIGTCAKQLGAREPSHVEVFAANRVVILPAGIGTRPPRRAVDGTVMTARCYSALVTLAPTGVVFVRPGAHLRVADLFRSWGQPLSRRRLASFTATPGSDVIAFVDGRRWREAPGAVPLTRHAEIVLEVGPFVPPHRSFMFPRGT